MDKEKRDELNQKGKGLIKEFKIFISRGNVLDLSVGIIVGGAFTAIVTALTSNIIMPLIGVMIGGVDFANLAITFKGESIGYGAFIQAVINFILVAFTVFLLIKAINVFLRKKEEKKEPEPQKPSEEILLLTQIRDLLQKQQENNCK